MNRLKEVRKAKGFTQTEIATILGITQNAYCYWEKDKVKIDNQSLKKLADFYGVSVDYLLGRNESTLPRNVYPVSKMVEIPILGSVRAGVGGHFEEEQLGMQTLPIEFLHDHLPQDVFFLQVKGDSMYPRIEEGCLALVKRQTSVDSGTVAVVSIDNEEAVIKKVYYDKDWIELVSFNPNYPTRRFEGPEVMRVYVVGKVISTMQNW